MSNIINKHINSDTRFHITNEKLVAKPKDIFETIVLDDLDGDMLDLAETIGIKAMRKILRDFGGSNLRIRMPKSFPKLVERTYKTYKHSPNKAAKLLGCTVDNLRRKALIMGWSTNTSNTLLINNLKAKRNIKR